MTQTAVDYLIERIKKDQNSEALTPAEWLRVFEQAKQMEDEQLQAKYGEGYHEGLYDSENK